ncbi:sensor histidine kinase [Reichenbachiella versicolor]|uniref:sensor histidine kinase n=1 Tax=Reichenbachiella versicolor TaxID=1821036 RepID=UPI000D6DD0B6|nr:HAMP domain-containing sensor histidine kinase [Reichenbachiella versicolor]
MSKRVFYTVLFLAVCSILGIVAVQTFWLNKAFNLKQQQFEYEVSVALLNVTDRLCEINQSELPDDPIEKLSSNYFIVNLNNSISPRVLELILLEEFTKREMDQAFEYAIFDCTDQTMVYGSYLSTDEMRVRTDDFPVLDKDEYYFGVRFPRMRSYVSGEMDIWWFSSIVLVLVIAFFSYALFAIFRQRQLSEIQKDFVNNMTHEFKTPIASIQLASYAISESLSNENRFKQYASIIQLESERLKNQVDRVLDITSLEGKVIDLKYESCDLIQLIDEAIQRVSALLDQSNGNVKVIESDKKININVDKFHFENVLVNILDNAIKYCVKQPLIRVELEQRKNKVLIKVIDNGIGMDEGVNRRIFKKFYRVTNNDLYSVKGFGLGLYYAKTIVEAHGGSIEVESNLSGSTFLITL